MKVRLETLCEKWFLKHFSETRVWKLQVSYVVRTYPRGHRWMWLINCVGLSRTLRGKKEDIRLVNGKGYDPVGNHALHGDQVAMQSLCLPQSLWSKFDL